MKLRNILAVVAFGVPAVAHADKKDEFRAFTQSKYSYCDAKVLSALWKSSISDSKATIGRKVLNNSTAGLEKNLEAALNAAEKNPKLRCKFHEAGLNYDDAKKLAKYWSVSVAEAKTLAEDKIVGGGESFVMEIVGKGKQPANKKELEAFAGSKYKYCDAKLLAGLWSSSVEDAKVTIGAKVLARAQTTVEKLLTDARKKAATTASMRCHYFEAGFTFEDIEKLSKIWKKTISESKALAGDKITYGSEDVLRKLLGKR
jgi:tyrosine-protein phosphatase YwqE